MLLQNRNFPQILLFQCSRHFPQFPFLLVPLLQLTQHFGVPLLSELNGFQHQRNTFDFKGLSHRKIIPSVRRFLRMSTGGIRISVFPLGSRPPQHDRSRQLRCLDMTICRRTHQQHFIDQNPLDPHVRKTDEVEQARASQSYSAVKGSTM